MTTTISQAARWSKGGYAKPYPWAQCRYCGRAQDYDCKPVECMACGSRQCHGNGSRNGTCAVCLVGYLPGWGHSLAQTRCGYAHCDNQAVARVPRVGQACAEHLRPAVRAKITERVAHRDSGKGWEHWRWVE